MRKRFKAKPSHNHSAPDPRSDSRNNFERYRDAPRTYSTPSPVPRESGGGNLSNYCCSSCGASAYYDGRCGDGPILTCGCDKAEWDYWANDRR